MELTEKRAEKIGKNVEELIRAMNGFTQEELEALIEVGQRETSIGPIIDPTRYRAESEAIRSTQIFLNSLLQFKREVKGLGNCR